MSNVDLEKFAEKLGNNLFSDLKKDLKVFIPRWLETMLEQRFKGLTEVEERIDRMEQELRAQGKDMERLLLLNEKQFEQTKDIKISTDLLPNEIKQTIKEDNKELAGAIKDDLENLSEQKSKSLLRFFKRGKK